MTEWFEQAFGPAYTQLYAHRDAAEAEQAVSLILDTVQLPSGSRILDAPCGYGRHTGIFASRGFQAVGLDLSRHLLSLTAQQASGQATIAPLPVNYVRGDLRTLPFATASFPLVVNLFTSIGYFQTDEENVHAIRELARVCARGGWVAIDYLNAEMVAEFDRERTLADGRIVEESTRIVGMPPRIEKRIRIRGEHAEQASLESVRLYAEEDLNVILESCQLLPIRKFGNYTGAIFDPENSPRLFVVAAKL